jgi:hypothetical protein
MRIRVTTISRKWVDGSTNTEVILYFSDLCYVIELCAKIEP